MIHQSSRSPAQVYHPIARIMAFLAEQKIASAHQIHQFCFPGKTDRNVRLFLATLTKRGWIGNQAVIGKSHKPMNAYKLTNNGFKELKSIIGLEIEKIQTRVNRREHDLVLTDIRIRFAHSPKARIYLSENLLQTGIFEGVCPQLAHFRSARNDGAVQLFISDSKIWMGVEYERSEKTKDRYIERFRNWYQSEELTGILLIAEDEPFMNRLIQIDRQAYPNFKRKILFQHLNGFLGSGASVTFTTSQGKEFSINFGSSMNTIYPILEQDLSF